MDFSYLRSGFMKWSYRILRLILITAILLMAVVPAVMYVAFSLSGVQRSIADRIETELSRTLDARVTIGTLNIIPFNRALLRDVTVETAPGDTALTVSRLGAGVSLWDLLVQKRYRVNYVELIGMDLKLRRDSASAPLNIQPIITALSPKDKSKPPTRFDLQVSTVIIRASSVRYDQLDAPSTPGRFNPRHLEVSRLRADINLPRIANDDFTINIRRMAMQEQSGLTVRKLAGDFHIAATGLSADGLDIELPGSRLKFTGMKLPLNGLKSIRESLARHPVTVELTERSHLWAPDFAALYPPLAHVEEMLTFPRFKITGTPTDISADIHLELEDLLSLELTAQGSALDSHARHFRVERLNLAASAAKLADKLSQAGIIPDRLRSPLAQLGAVGISAEGEGSADNFSAEAAVSAAPGAVAASASGSFSDSKHFSITGSVTTKDALDLASILPKQAPSADGTVDFTYQCAGAQRHGTADILLSSLGMTGYSLTDVAAHLAIDNNMVSAHLDCGDNDASFVAESTFSIDPKAPAITLSSAINRFTPSRFGLLPKYPGATICADIDIDAEGESWNTLTGHANVDNLSLKPVDSEGISMRHFGITTNQPSTGQSRIDISSDYLDGTLLGSFNLKTLGHSVLDVLSTAFPALVPGHQHDTPEAPRVNDFIFDFKIKETENLAEFFNLPVSVIYPVSVRGAVDQTSRDLEFNLSAPYLRQGSKLIENTSLSAYVDGREERARLNFCSSVPTKGGPMALEVKASGRNDTLRTTFGWKIDRQRDYEGKIRLATSFSRDEEGQLLTSVAFRPSTATFNDSTWTITPATINIKGRDISVDGLNVTHGNQYIHINGNVSPDPTSLLTLNLRDFSLDYLFESLGIDAAMLGGDASGTFYASEIYSGSPRLETPGLHVKDISYNQTVLGDAVVRSWFNTDNKAVELRADIDNDGRKSTIDGAIFATRDSLDLTFHVDRVPVGFLEHYMNAFSSDVKGYASGWARVYGNFKYIDLEGDVLADSVQLKVNFTNTTYWASDSVHIRPGRIDLKNITIHDFHGHSAMLNGWVSHTFFKEPRFEFSITGANGLLSYDESAKENPRWYGTVYGNGSAFVKGVPGRVDINVDMSTSPGSTFTFVLSDQTEADEYSFLTFRDKGKLEAELTDTIVMRDTSMDLVNRLREQASRHDDSSPSDYNITIQMGITPDARIILVMDPVGGDRIRAYGSGHIRMDYGSANNELKMYGNYTLDRGDYNFTLQDIIIKDFSIKPGSEISFRGDPYAAQLDIRAAYSLNANLSDLDESFLNDNELNRTNVPVNAIMKITGDIRQPEIAFDLEFPTLTSDIYRKVRSIISTDEMMNRQILYLLALNRFYTPDYMAGATRGNELVSVASSTLSSQLGNILGQISDNWNIAPTLRSSRGDFSDVEVDVALSSRLLNNRLLFNGNFGYRDKSLNTNQFVGDFELEYLLNRSGNFRLKAYNRYNDQNYYLRSALTTQGVGIVLRKDFDSLTSFLRPLFRRRKKTPAPDKVTPAQGKPSPAPVPHKAAPEAASR